MSASGAPSPETEQRAEAAAAGGATHPRSFKLRFAAQREPGRSYVSAVKPLGLPATVTGKFYARPQPADERSPEAALRRIRAMFALGPRERLPAPGTSAQEVGWWAAGVPPAPRGDRRLNHHVRDSAWLKARLRVLAHDARLQRP